MASSNEFREAIEACRPGSNDVAAPEMAALRHKLADDPALRGVYERTQRADAALAHAFHEVPVPAGLEQRLLAALGVAAAGEQPAGEQPAAAMAVRESELVATKSITPVRRSRRWLIGAGIVAAAACLLLAVLFPRTPVTPSHEQLARDAQAWTEQIVERESTNGWQPFDEQRFPTLDWHSARWRTLRTQLDRRAVVFDFPLRGDRRLLVYRLATKRNLNLPSLPYQSLTTTGKWRVAAWQESQYVYVAVTNRPELLEALRTGPGPA